MKRRTPEKIIDDIMLLDLKDLVKLQDLFYEKYNVAMGFIMNPKLSAVIEVSRRDKEYVDNNAGKTYTETATITGGATHTVTHNLGTQAVVVSVRQSTGEEIIVENAAATVNTVTVDSLVTITNAIITVVGA